MANSGGGSGSGRVASLAEMDSDDEFEDAQEEPPPQPPPPQSIPTKSSSSEVMNLKIALNEAKLAIDYFFNNDLDRARNLLTPWADESMYHAMGISVFSFLEAILTFEQEHIKVASAHLNKCLDICHKNRYTSLAGGGGRGSFLPKFNLAKDMLTPSAFSSNSDYFNKMTDLEAHAELCYAEMLLLKSILTFIEDETLKNLLLGGIKIRNCYNCYKICDEILKKRQCWESDDSKLHFESGVKMGIGTFNLMISMLPQRVIKLLEFIGFSGNKRTGLSDLVAGYNMENGLRRILCVMNLLGYHLIITQVVCYQDGDLEFANEILQKQLKIYPNGLWFLFFKGRLEFMRGNLDEAITWYNKSITTEQRMWSHFNHLCYWELLWVNTLNRNYCEAYQYAKRLFNENKWSRTIYLYQKCIILMEFKGHPDLNPDPMTAVPSIELRHELEKELTQLDSNLDYCKFYKQKLSGKSLPMEKFILKKVKRYFRQGNHLVLPIFELVYVWNLFKCFQIKADANMATTARNTGLLQNFLKLFERHEAFLADQFRAKQNADLNQFYYDNMTLLAILRGVCLKYLNLPLQALQQFQDALQHRAEVKEDTHLIPFCIVEIGLIEGNDLQNYERAVACLEDAKKNFTGYSLESRLHFRIHSALNEFKARLKEAKSQEADSSPELVGPAGRAGGSSSARSSRRHR